MTIVSRETLQAALQDGIQQLGLQLNASQVEQLLAYLALLQKWNKVYNLTAVREPMQMLTHHLLDSLAAIPAFVGAKRVLDVGAGGGLPGLVLAIAQPETHVTLIDTVHKKTAFLTQVKAELGLANVSVQTGRVEQYQAPQLFDVITSRAFAELADFVNWSGHLLAEGGQFIALKGVDPDTEKQKLPAQWQVAKVEALQVPQLDAARHLVFITRQINSQH
ncbi:MAG: 16S rRNA (guanine(527)-N(7))-methyltransferase RsmG [Burkholderiales bacterium]|nr:16S rRNA (guanine(527)-N(7))-methyltransferase RsmG [Burkholderiales bacterium]